MGYACTQTNVILFLTALGNILQTMGQKIDKKGAIDAAVAVFG
jgi:hypothetical protein